MLGEGKRRRGCFSGWQLGLATSLERVTQPLGARHQQPCYSSVPCTAGRPHHHTTCISPSTLAFPPKSRRKSTWQSRRRHLVLSGDCSSAAKSDQKPFSDKPAKASLAAPVGPESGDTQVSRERRREGFSRERERTMWDQSIF